MDDTWLDELDTVKRSSDALLPADGVLKAHEIVAAAAEAMASGVVVKDSGSHKYWVTKLGPCASPDRSLASCHFGAMAFALPAAIGAAIARPDEPIIVTCGDGGLLMALNELHTAVTQRCDNLKIIVFNNSGLGSTRDYEWSTGVTRALSDFVEPIGFAAIAQALGIASQTIRTRSEVTTMSARLRHPGLMLFDCMIDPLETMRPCVGYSQPLRALAPVLPPAIPLGAD